MFWFDAADICANITNLIIKINEIEIIFSTVNEHLNFYTDKLFKSISFYIL